jgi:hypothetical protein
MEQLESQLPAADVVLDQALLDRIDEIVPPVAFLAVGHRGWLKSAPGARGRAASRRRPRTPRRSPE